MKRIGDVMKDISIRPAPPTLAGNITISRKETADCQICQDAGYLRADVPVGHPLFGRLQTCICRERKIDDQVAENLRNLSNLDMFSKHTFDHFDDDVPLAREAFDAAKRFADECALPWLFLSGPCGTGKTHLAVAICKDYQENRRGSVHFAVVPDLLDHLRATFDPSSSVEYDERFTMFRDAHLLVLDDLGTENATPWAKEKLYQIINHRYIQQSPTVITSNRIDKIEGRILSRILDYQLSEHIEMKGEDYRRSGDPRRMRRTRRS